MKTLDFSRRALGFFATLAMLAGCGQSQPPLSSSPAGFAPQRSLVREAYLVLHGFGGSGDGMNPHAGLLDIKGILYGTTVNGGSNNAGAVFAITETGKETVLHSFDGSGGGAHPEAGLIEVKGTLYGTTRAGGAYGFGTVFSISTNGNEKVLHSFNYDGTDGLWPYAALIDVGGMLYGTTVGGGAFSCSGSSDDGCGTVFSITTTGRESVLHSFGGAGDGMNPYAGLIDIKGTLYGTTFGGAYKPYNGGTVFSVTTGGAEKVLYGFGRSGDGVQPEAGLIDVKGTLYGTTSAGGAYHGGTVFTITTGGTEKVLHSFVGYPKSDGAYPLASLVNVNGTLYGTTSEGGRYHSSGTVFSITAGGNEKVLHSFGKGTDGNDPNSGLIKLSDRFYGTTSAGGPYGEGTVFALTP